MTCIKSLSQKFYFSILVLKRGKFFYKFQVSGEVRPELGVQHQDSIGQLLHQG